MRGYVEQLHLQMSVLENKVQVTPGVEKTRVFSVQNTRDMQLL